MIIDQLLQKSDVDRVIDLERRESAGQIEGDFTGSVAGTWVKLDSSGAGIVKYGDKEYYAKRIGFTSVPAGTSVELSFGNGVYYASW